VSAENITPEIPAEVKGGDELSPMQCCGSCRHFTTLPPDKWGEVEYDCLMPVPCWVGEPATEIWPEGGTNCATYAPTDGVELVRASTTHEDQSAENAEVVGIVRQIANEVTGGNCGFADDDARVLGALAKWAIENGVPEEICPAIIRTAKRYRGIELSTPRPSAPAGIAALHNANRENKPLPAEDEDPRWLAWEAFLRDHPHEVPPRVREAMAEYQRIQQIKHVRSVKFREDLTAAELLQCLPLPSPIDIGHFEALSEFARVMISYSWEGDADGADIQEIAHRLGLIIEEAATAADCVEGNFDQGDPIYRFAPWLREDEPQPLRQELPPESTDVDHAPIQSMQEDIVSSHQSGGVGE
jgi:hypothetical protein